ncbi:hypothetical protein CSKR_102804 [Clonorchis sinensis]|uniref:Uncharacterized protein n=1 Tax=Clonorchis sinensis TaxID=79923 RepID=A0A419Q7V8_CLOSI|nr:hypothetical protein CSKR_102804 [Clonorchis sinensis]
MSRTTSTAAVMRTSAQNPQKRKQKQHTRKTTERTKTTERHTRLTNKIIQKKNTAAQESQSSIPTDTKTASPTLLTTQQSYSIPTETTDDSPPTTTGITAGSIGQPENSNIDENVHTSSSIGEPISAIPMSIHTETAATTVNSTLMSSSISNQTLYHNSQTTDGVTSSAIGNTQISETDDNRATSVGMTENGTQISMFTDGDNNASTVLSTEAPCSVPIDSSSQTIMTCGSLGNVTAFLKAYEIVELFVRSPEKLGGIPLSTEAFPAASAFPSTQQSFSIPSASADNISLLCVAAVSNGLPHTSHRGFLHSPVVSIYANHVVDPSILSIPGDNSSMSTGSSTLPLQTERTLRTHRSPLVLRQPNKQQPTKRHCLDGPQATAARITEVQISGRYCKNTTDSSRQSKYKYSFGVSSPIYFKELHTPGHTNLVNYISVNMKYGMRARLADGLILLRCTISGRACEEELQNAGHIETQKFVSISEQHQGGNIRPGGPVVLQIRKVDSDVGSEMAFAYFEAEWASREAFGDNRNASAAWDLGRHMRSHRNKEKQVQFLASPGNASSRKLVIQQSINQLFTLLSHAQALPPPNYLSVGGPNHPVTSWYPQKSPLRLSPPLDQIDVEDWSQLVTHLTFGACTLEIDLVNDCLCPTAAVDPKFPDSDHCIVTCRWTSIQHFHTPSPLSSFLLSSGIFEARCATKRVKYESHKFFPSQADSPRCCYN